MSEREFKRVRQRLDFSLEQLSAVEIDPNQGPGNVLMLEYAHEHVTEVFSALAWPGFALKPWPMRRSTRPCNGRPATRRWANTWPINSLLPMALAGGGSFTTAQMSDHLHSNMAVIRRFLPVVIESHEQEQGGLKVECRTR